MQKSKIRVNLDRLSLDGKNSSGKDSKVVLSVRDGFPRFVGFINDDKKREGVDNMIFCTFNFKNIFLFISDVIEMTNRDKPSSVFGMCINTRYDKVNKKRTDELYTQGAIKLTKDEKGIITVMLQDGDVKDKKLEFKVGPEIWTKIKVGDVIVTDQDKISNKIINMAFTKYDQVLTGILTEHSVTKAATIE